MKTAKGTDKQIIIKKASGEEEVFDVAKLFHSLQKAGASHQLIEEVVADIKNWIFEGATTREIYRRAFRLLNQRSVSNALRYRLKQALCEFGSSGYPFEHFIGEIFKKMGYSVEVGKVLQGNCITHEMDVIATTKKQQILVECKYSQDQGKYVSIQVPLYVRSRVDDIVKFRAQQAEYKSFAFQACIATNSRFSSDSLTYSKCNGIRLIGWDYPEGNGLRELIDRERVYPITVLSGLDKKAASWLINKGIVSTNQLSENPELLKEIDINPSKYRKIRQELDQIENAKIIS